MSIEPYHMNQLLAPDITVLADTDMSHTISLLARVARARNPRMLIPPTSSLVWESMQNADGAKRLMDTLTAAAYDPFFLRPGLGKDVLPPVLSAVHGDWLIALVNVGLTGLLSFPRAYARSVTQLDEALDHLSKPENISISIDPSIGLEQMIEKDPLRGPFTVVTLSLAYEAILKSGLFDKVDSSDLPLDRNQRALTERGLLMTTLIRTIAIQPTLLRVRPTLRYLRSDIAKRRLRDDADVSRVEYWEAIMDRILALPVHPWVATAERISLPASRMTPWGDSTPTMILDRTALHSRWDGEGPMSDHQDAITHMEQALNPTALLERYQPLLRSLRDTLDELETGGRMAKVSTILSFTAPSGPIAAPLFSTAIQPIFMDGLHSTAAISDLVAASYGLHLPVQTGMSTPWIGDRGFMPYRGGMRANGSGSIWGEHVGSISVPPEEVSADMSYYIRRFNPRALRWFNDSFLGDFEAKYPIPPTVDGLATLLGTTPADLSQEILKDPRSWSHVFKVTRDAKKEDVQHIVPAKSGEFLFYSARTQQTWLTTMELPRMGTPIVMWAFRDGKPVTALPTMAEFIRDPAIPVATVPMAGAVDSLIKLALPYPMTGNPR